MPDWSGKTEWAERRGRLFVANLPYFDAWLGDRRFLAGDDFSMADITLFATLAFAGGAGLPIAPELQSLAAWRERVEAVPAVRNRSGQSFLPEDIARMSAG
jgi:glutathione S-transferase